MEYAVPACPESLGTSVNAYIGWTAGVAAMATRCQADAVEGLSMPCEDIDCGDTHVCGRCAMTLEIAGIRVETALAEYLPQVEDVVIQSLAEYDPLGVECLTNLVARNIRSIQM